MFESLIISEYLSDRFGDQVQFLPQDPHERAAVRMFIVAVDKGLFSPVFFKGFLNEKRIILSLKI